MSQINVHGSKYGESLKKIMAQITVHGSKYGESLKKSWHKLLCMVQSMVSH